jgi:hypothetical protein
MTDEQYENLISVLTISLARIYDAVMVQIDKPTRDSLVKAHEDGNLIGPAPWINEEIYTAWSGE